MSNIQTGAERMPHDLSHLGFLAGQIGRLITISTTPVGPGARRCGSGCSWVNSVVRARVIDGRPRKRGVVRRDGIRRSARGRQASGSRPGTAVKLRWCADSDSNSAASARPGAGSTVVAESPDESNSELCVMESITLSFPGWLSRPPSTAPRTSAIEFIDAARCPRRLITSSASTTRPTTSAMSSASTPPVTRRRRPARARGRPR